MGRAKAFDPDAAVEQAMDLFWRKGFGATTPQDLVAELGIGKGSLYNAFDSKRALFDRALARYTDMRAAALTEALTGPGPARERVRAALLHLANAPDPARGCLAVNTAAELTGDPVAAALVDRMFGRVEDAFRVAIEDGQRSGEFAAGRDPGQLATLLLSSFIGMVVVAKTGATERTRRAADAVLAIL
ncbi:TetR/AcrR family transcriptional regulator [Dactylosporangium sp. NPDC051485]|uniref:TetR/AcrR family transcriptional regulator n=1 Tax=Dactylosporangium sp. NPDC051485 TaxID=3154846 RepID=UPI0034287206